MRSRISVMAISWALLSGAAQAADLPSGKAAPVFVPPPTFSWTGPYAGLNLGGGWIERRRHYWLDAWSSAWGWNNNSNNNSGVVGGGQIGYNYQLSPLFVVGVETDIQGTSIGGNRNNNNWGWGWGGGDFNRVSVPWFGTVRARVGLSLLDSRLLIYGTGGFAYGEVDRVALGWWDNNNGVRGGWTAGGGVEWAFLPNWSAKIEYLYTELQGNNNNNNWWIAPIVFPGVLPAGAWGSNWSRRANLSTVRAGVNYHFNLFTPAPVVARY